MRGEGLKDDFEGPDLNKQVACWGQWDGGDPSGEFRSSLYLSVWCLSISKGKDQLSSWRKYSRRDG